MRTGMVYRIFGLGLDEGQLSRMFRRDCESSPSASVSIAVDGHYQPDDNVYVTHKRTYHLAMQCVEHRNDATDLCH